MPVQRNFYTVREAAAALNVAESTIRGAILDGALKAEKVGERLSAIAPEEIELYRREHLGKRGWDRRRQADHVPSKQAHYAREYRARRARADQQPDELAERIER